MRASHRSHHALSQSNDHCGTKPAHAVKYVLKRDNGSGSMCSDGRACRSYVPIQPPLPSGISPFAKGERSLDRGGWSKTIMWCIPTAITNRMPTTEIREGAGVMIGNRLKLFVIQRLKSGSELSSVQATVGKTSSAVQVSANGAIYVVQEYVHRTRSRTSALTWYRKASAGLCLHSCLAIRRRRMRSGGQNSIFVKLHDVGRMIRRILRLSQITKIQIDVVRKLTSCYPSG